MKGEHDRSYSGENESLADSKGHFEHECYHKASGGGLLYPDPVIDGEARPSQVL